MEPRGLQMGPLRIRFECSVPSTRPYVVSVEPCRLCLACISWALPRLHITWQSTRTPKGVRSVAALLAHLSVVAGHLHVRSPSMNRRWWKAYFLVALILTAGGFVFSWFADIEWGMRWWEWLFVPLYALQIFALYCFAFWHRVGVRRGWKLLFVASVLYEIWCLVELTMTPELESISQAQGFFLASTIGGTLAIQMPMLVALFLYAFRSEELWHGAT